MKNKRITRFSLLMVLVVIASACAPATVTVVVTPTPVPATQVVRATTASTPTLTLTPSETPTPSSTPTSRVSPTPTTMSVLVTVTPSRTPGSCQPKYQPQDVTIPDGTEMAAGETFTKTWSLRDEACNWRGYTLEYLGGTLATSITSVVVPNANPGKTVTVTVNQISPRWPGSYVSFWALKDANGQVFGILTIVITVEGNDVAIGPNGCKLDDSYVADMNFLDGDPVFPGEDFTKTWRIQNNGNCPHGKDYELTLVVGNITPTASNVPAIPAGSKGDVSANFKAPDEPGWYYVLVEVRAPNGANTATLTMIVRVEPEE